MNNRPHLQPISRDDAVATSSPELRFDPLDVGALPPTSGAELDYRTELQSPGECGRRTACDLLCFIAVVVLLTTLIRTLNIVVGGWWVSAAVLLAGLTVAAWTFLRTELRELRIELVFAGLMAGVFGFIMLAPTARTPIEWILTMLIPVMLLTLLGWRVTVHYLFWLNANPFLGRGVRCYVHRELCLPMLQYDFNPVYRERQLARLGAGAPDVVNGQRPTRDDVTSDRAIQGWSLLGVAGLLSIPVIYCGIPLSHDTDFHFPSDMDPYLFGSLYERMLTGGVVLAVPVIAFLLTAIRRYLRQICGASPGPAPRTRIERLLCWIPLLDPFLITWHAIVSYHTYNRHETNAAGVFQSPYGPWWQRRILAGLAIGATCFATLPFSGYGAAPTRMMGHAIAGAAIPWPWESEPPPSSPRAEQQRVARVIQHPEGYPTGMLRGIMLGLPDFAVLFGAMILISLLWPFFFCLAVIGAVGTPMLHHAYPRLDSGDGYLDSALRSGTLWAAYVRRLQDSPYETTDSMGATVRERDHILVGFNLLSDYPVLMHRDMLRGHAHMTGDTGSGKSTLGGANLCNQLIGRPNTSMVILDLKGDAALFAGVRSEAATAGVEFKWFTNRANRTTFAFNPFLQEHFDTVTPHQRTEMLLKSLGLEYGEAYGAAFFSAGHRHVLSEVFAARPNIRSFRELDQFLREEFPGLYRQMGISKKEYEDAAHLYTVVHSLATFDALNIADDAKDLSYHCRIDMSEIVRRPQIAYFFLPASVEQKSVREIARLALHSLLTAASERGASKHEVFLFIDEFAQVVDTALEVILQQARDMGICAILANQSLAQLQNASANLIPTVLANTRGRLIFSASDPHQQDTLLKVAGETGYSMGTWLRAAQAYLSGTSMGELVANSGSGPISPAFPLDRASEQRLNRNDLIEISNHPLRCVAQFTRQAGFTCFRGYPFPMHAQFHITSEMYQLRRNAEWPEEQPWLLVQRVSPQPQRQDRRPEPPAADEANGVPVEAPKPPPTLPPKNAAPERPDARAKGRPRSVEQALIRGIDKL